MASPYKLPKKEEMQKRLADARTRSQRSYAANDPTLGQPLPVIEDALQQPPRGLRADTLTGTDPEARTARERFANVLSLGQGRGTGTLARPLADAIFGTGYGSMTGGSAKLPNAPGQSSLAPADIIPGLGEILSGAEGTEAAKKGDWLGAGLGAIGAAGLPGFGKGAKAGEELVTDVTRTGERAADDIARTGGKVGEHGLFTASGGGLKPASEAKVISGPEPDFVPASPTTRDDVARVVGQGTQGLKSDLPLSGGRISQRFPKEAKAGGWAGKENPLTENLLINTDVLRHDPAKMQQASDIIGRYPTTTNAMLEMHPPERIEAFKQAVAANFGALYDLMTPEQQARASQWYWGANRIAGERANEIGIHPNASAGMYAALSPQKDWFQNVYLGDQVGRILHHDPKVTIDMMRKAQTLPVYTEDGASEMLRSLEGRKLSSMTPEEQALAVRLHEETYGPITDKVGGERAYRAISPEGDYGNYVLTKGGEPRRPAWGSFGEIQKSIEAAQSGGDPNIISPLMGEKHKVRHFYNDIVNPGEAETFGDITVDTHQIGGGLFSPLTGKSEEVAHGLGSSPAKGIPGAPQSAVTGLQGLYPLYADATRQAAAERGVPVIAMQSTPWEALRALFPPEFRTAKNQEAVANVWREHAQGSITAEEARRRIIGLAGGFNAPSW